MNRVTINGTVIENANSVDVVGRQVIVNGKVMQDIDINSGTLRIQIDGDLASLTCDGSATVNGNVGGSVSSGGSFTGRDVGGDVKAGGSINAHKAKAGGSINIG